MAQSEKWLGGVIVAPDHHTHGLIGLLTSPIRNQLDLAFYHHAFQIDVEVYHDFIIVLSLEDLRTVIKHYDAKRLDLPLIVHIDHPEIIESTRYDVMFPGVWIHAVPQPALDLEPGVTLEVNQFVQVVEKLGARPLTGGDLGAEAPGRDGSGYRQHI